MSATDDADPQEPLSAGAMSLADAVGLVRATAMSPEDRPWPGEVSAAAAHGPRPVGPPAVSRVGAWTDPVRTVERALAAINSTDCRWRAWAHVDRPGALARSRAARSRLAAGRARRALEGLPIGVKDVIDVAGMPCVAGFPPFADRVPVVDAVVVRRLVAAGAIVLGKTVTTQFAFSDPAATVNPWDPGRTPGGSSSGSAVAVAVGHVPAALGTQTSGSVIRPAAYTGVFGFKPSRGRLSRTGVYPLAWSIDEVGILADSVTTCAQLFGVAAGIGLDNSRPRHGVRIGLLEDAFELATGEVADSVAWFGEQLANEGAELVPLRLGRLVEIAAVHQVVMSAEIGTVHAQEYGRHPGQYRDRIARAVLAGQGVGGREYLDAQRLRRRLEAEVRAVFSNVDLWLSPSVAGVAPGRETTGDRSLQISASLLGLPAITVPSRPSPAGLPIGAQLVGAPGSDDLVLAVATAATSGRDDQLTGAQFGAQR